MLETTKNYYEKMVKRLAKEGLEKAGFYEEKAKKFEEVSERLDALYCIHGDLLFKKAKLLAEKRITRNYELYRRTLAETKIEAERKHNEMLNAMEREKYLENLLKDK